MPSQRWYCSAAGIDPTVSTNDAPPCEKGRSPNSGPALVLRTEHRSTGSCPSGFYPCRGDCERTPNTLNSSAQPPSHDRRVPRTGSVRQHSRRSKTPRSDGASVRREPDPYRHSVLRVRVSRRLPGTLRYGVHEADRRAGAVGRRGCPERLTPQAGLGVSDWNGYRTQSDGLQRLLHALGDDVPVVGQRESAAPCARNREGSLYRSAQVLIQGAVVPT